MLKLKQASLHSQQVIHEKALENMRVLSKHKVPVKGRLILDATTL